MNARHKLRQATIEESAAEDFSGTRLLGFDDTRNVDFRDDALAARMGAKVGNEPPEPKVISEGNLLGFDDANDVDFRDEALAARLGAKVGNGEPEPSNIADGELLGFDDAVFRSNAFASRAGAKISVEPFEHTGDESKVDFRSDAVASRVGAKVGLVEADKPANKHKSEAPSE
jgi:hypothetical protein